MVKQILKLTGVIFTLLALCWSIPAVAQNRTVTGVVTDTDGQPVVGASVFVAGDTRTGTATGENGQFSLSIPQNAVLTISSIGYKTVSLPTGNRSSFQVTLEEDSQFLEETVVIGYGTAKKSDVTGSIASVNQEVLRQIPAGDITTALQGRVAGVEMRQTSTKPGATMRIRIRGTRSLSADNNPLIVLDGIPFSGSLADINTDDVKSIDILKDASSTAIYGSRGANGVIMITTEHGAQGAPVRVNFNSYGMYKQWLPYPFMNTKQLTELRDLAKKYIDGADEYRDLYDTDWQAVYYEPGYAVQNNLSVTGSTNGGNFSLGASYYKDESNIPTEGFDRVNVRGSIDQKIGKYFAVGFSTNLGTNKNYGQGAGGAQVDLTPMVSPYDENGNIRRGAINMPKDQNYVVKTRELMYEIADKNINESIRYSAYNNAYVEVEAPFLKGLKYRLNGGYNFRLNESGTFRGEGILNSVLTEPATASRSWSLSKNWTLENLLTFNRTFNDVHNINITGMFSAESATSYGNSFSSRGVPADYMLYYYMGDGAGDLTFNPNSQSYSKTNLMSVMGRVMYSYANKYMISATVRSDGSSRLAEGKKWHTYPAVSLGWNISNEDFMRNVAWVDMLKIRAGYGQTSNQSISPYSTLGRLSSRYYNYDTDYVTAYYVTSLPNNDLGWEYSETWNFGIDYGFFNGRLSGSLEYYHVLTKDLLMTINLPSTAGVNSYTANVGKTMNNGIEFTVNGTIIQHRGDGFNWTAGLNFYHNHNEIVELASGQDEDRANNWYVGYPVNSFREYVYEGLWQQDEEAMREKLEPGGNVGMIKVQYNGEYDANGDPVRVIGDDDKVVMTNEAILQGGFNSTMSWKGFDFTVVGSFQVGGMLTSNIHNGYQNLLSGRRNNVVVDYWTPETPNVRFPAPGGATSGGDNAKYIETASRWSGSNVLINTITLGYNFGNLRAVKNFGLRSCRLYATVQNPFVVYSPFYKETGIRPVSNSGAYAVSQGTPPTVNYLLGLNLSF